MKMSAHLQRAIDNMTYIAHHLIADDEANEVISRLREAVLKTFNFQSLIIVCSYLTIFLVSFDSTSIYLKEKRKFNFRFKMIGSLWG